MTLFCWGGNPNGTLGGIEEEHVIFPQELDWPLAANIESISIGSCHTLFLVSGKVYSSGSNDFGQLGHNQARKRPCMFSN